MRYASDHPEFHDLLRATAEALDFPIWIVEKDYYVTRALRPLCDQIGNQFLFKGGTSLSKAFKIIERFSEDIDLLFRMEQDGKSLSKNRRHKRFKTAEEIVAGTPGLNLIKPQGLSSETGMHRESWFAYPASAAPAGATSDKIRLEMNCRGGREPHQLRPIRSFVAEFAANQNAADMGDDLDSFSIDCLDVTRTFVEKLFAAYYAYTIDRALGRTRHYCDLYHIAGLPEVQAFIASPDFTVVVEDVRQSSIQHWPNRQVPPGIGFAEYSFLSPSPEHLAELTRNYASERVLFFHEPPTMKVILERLQQLSFPRHAV